MSIPDCKLIKTHVVMFLVHFSVMGPENHPNSSSSYGAPATTYILVIVSSVLILL